MSCMCVMRCYVMPKNIYLIKENMNSLFLHFSPCSKECVGCQRKASLKAMIGTWVINWGTWRPTDHIHQPTADTLHHNVALCSTPFQPSTSLDRYFSNSSTCFLSFSVDRTQLNGFGEYGYNPISAELKSATASGALLLASGKLKVKSCNLLIMGMKTLAHFFWFSWKQIFGRSLHGTHSIVNRSHSKP
jgi:hypothetical protein